MDKLVDKISQFVQPFADWIHRMKLLMAISETMQALLPFMVIGSFCCLFAFVSITPWQNFLAANPIIAKTFMNGQGLTLSIISFYVVIILSYLYAKRLEMPEPLAVVPVAVGCFLLITPTELYTSIPTEWLGHKGMITAFITVYVVVRIIKLFQDHNISIKMPAGVPHFVTATFAVLIPASILIFGFSLLGQCLADTEIGSVHQLIYTFLQAPLTNIGTSFGGLLVTELIMTLAMFCGIHGSSVVPFMDALQLATTEENASAIASGLTPPNIYCYGTTDLIQMGGIGATLGLGLLLFFFAKSKRYKQLARVAIVPQIFNIGEPLLFGIPIMLNPVLFIPYMLGVVMNTIVVYGSVAIGLVAPFNGVNPSWTMPGVLTGALTCTVPWQGVLLALVVIAMDMAIWFPFVKLIDKQEVEAESKAAAEE